MVIGPAVEKRKSNRVAVPQNMSSPGMRERPSVIVFATRSREVVTMSPGMKRAGGSVSSP